MNIDKYLAKIRGKARRKGISRFRLALSAGISENGLKDLWDEDWAPRITTLRKLETALATLKDIR